MSCTQKQQLVCFPKVRVYKPWFRHFNDHKDFRNEGTVHLFSLMALFSYANFRSNERVINGDRYMEAPGQWICKLGALPRILRVHSKAQALKLMEHFQDHGFLTFEMASIMIHKIDAATGAGIYGVKFVLYDSGKNPIGEYTTDQDGYIYIDDELVPGKYYLRELEAADGYIRDEQYKTVYVERGKCAQIEWENSAVTGQIQIRKYSSEDNTVTGQLAGTPLEGAVFEITQARSGKVVGYIVTDARGVAASGPLPLGRYFVTEVSAPKYYQLSGEKMEAEIEYPSQIIKLSAYNKPATLGVTIKKSGNYEVQSGQTMSYDFSGIANTSNVALNHFFWHDRIPTDATRALSISTGTYNARLYYKVTFKTNLNDYRTLASNLLTSNNYSLSLNAATLRLVQGEHVTDVRFEFGTVPSGFSSVVKPTMRVQVLGTVSNGYQIINRADVGGQYLNEWQTAKTTWVTTVRRFNTTPLPKTGY